MGFYPNYGCIFLLQNGQGLFIFTTKPHPLQTLIFPLFNNQSHETQVSGQGIALFGIPAAK